ncbi:ral guanine nucleotide dissociation stimulator-like [Pteropus medius]|uniref:ral guanine nucleotide dissociation stimulator-like n=1 Tax=Pteropus vampyrus TaxID=132908 RepID=UPI00196AE7C3|nr:ral guanine nucleotide dissociation stimulator-like [Pteropus giganteus]
MVPSARARRLDGLIASLVPAFLGSDLTFVSAFLGTYKSFTTTQRVLDTLCARYGCIFPNSEGDGGPVDQVKGAIYSILGIWLDQHHEDFFQPPEFPCLRLLLAYIQLNFRGSSLEHQVQLLLSALTDLESPEAETEGPDEDQESTQEVTPTSSVVPCTESEASGGSASPEGEEAEWEDTPHAIPGMSGGSASPEGADGQQMACLGSSEALRARF